MAWILLEGLDRSGKSSVAETYRKKGYEVVHMSAPDKKYFQPGYAGPSYLEEIVDIYSIYDGKDVVFDRTIYGEYIWPEIFNRMPMLNEDDIEYLSRLEYNNNASKILMHDDDIESHWQRCLDNNEPLNRLQFVQAGRLYDKLASKHNFNKLQLPEFLEDIDNEETIEEVYEDERGADRDTDNYGDTLREQETTDRHKTRGEFLEEKIQRANAIRSLLNTKIVKKKGPEFDAIEEDIKNYLTEELDSIFSPRKSISFTDDEVQILKIYAARIIEKSTLK